MENSLPSALSTTARYAGTRMPRVEDARLLTGRGVFVDDIDRPTLLHAYFVRSTVAHARVMRLDVSAALTAVGVRTVLLASDINPHVREQWYTSMGRDVPDTPRPPLASDRVRFVGDPIAIVIATSRAAAVDAAELVEVDYELLPSAADYRDAPTSPELIHDAFAANLAGSIGRELGGKLGAIFDTAAHVARATISQAACTAAPLETRGLIVACAPHSDETTIWASTQAPHEVRMFCARLLGIAEHHVRVIMRDTGGGFGLKVVPMREDMCIMLAARTMRAEIKWVEDRRENLTSAGQARHEHGDAQLAFDTDGTLLAAYLDHGQDVGAYPTPWPVCNAAATGMLFPGPYRVPRASFRSTCVFSNTVGRAAYRGPWQFETVAREVLLDIAARDMGIDPVELRRRNLLRADEMPYANPNSMPYDHMAPTATFELALDLLDLDAFRAEQRAARAEGRYLGLGLSTYAEPTTTGMSYYATEGATIRIEPSGSVNVYVAGGSTGNSLETTAVQLTADALGVDPAMVATIQGDTAVTPFGAGTGGSRSGSMIAGAIATTAAELRARIVAIAAQRLEAAETDIELANGNAFVRGTPAIAVTLAQIAELAYFQPHALPAGVPPGLEVSGRYQTPSPMAWVNATHLCTCEVDIETGAVTLLRYIVSEDCGPMINPDIVEGQIAGGTAQGIAEALFEQSSYDADGNPLASSLLDYLVPSAAELIQFEFGHIETPGPGEGGYKGVGEGGAIGAPAAVVNAVADALAPFDVAITELPITPRRIVELLARRA